MPLKMFQEPEPDNNHSSSSFSKIRHVIGVAAGKGGVGKSTVTANLALALKKKGYRVGILDADIYGPSIRKMLPEDRLPGRYGDRLVPALCSGLSVISMAYFRPDTEAAAVRAPIANGLISQFIDQIEWGPLDYLLIDFPPGTGDIQLTLSQRANLSGALLVTTPQELALLDVRKAVNLFDRVQVPVVGVVENMSGYWHPGTAERIDIFGRGGGERLARECGVPFLGELPLDPKLCQSGDQGVSIFIENPQSAISEAFIALASSVEKHIEALQKERAGALGQFEMEWKR